MYREPMLERGGATRRDASTIAIALASLARPGSPPAGWVRRCLIIAAICVASSVATVIFSTLVHGDPAFSFGEHRLGTYASVAVLAAAAWAAWRVALQLDRDPFARVWRMGAVLLGFFAVDDFFMLHENADYIFHWLLARDPKDPLTDRIDDVIVITYPFVVAFFAWPSRKDLAALPWTLWSMVLALTMFAAMAVIDWLDASPIIEESIKIGAGGAILAAILAAEGQLAAREPSFTRSRSPERTSRFEGGPP